MRVALEPLQRGDINMDLLSFDPKELSCSVDNTSKQLRRIVRVQPIQRTS